jgi:hypothetical protein
MSTTLSEKNSPVMVPWPSAQRATGVLAGPGGLGLSGSRGSSSTERLAAVNVMGSSCSKIVEVGRVRVGIEVLPVRWDPYPEVSDSGVVASWRFMSWFLSLVGGR